MSYGLGLKAIRALVAEGNALAFHHAKLSEKLFKGDMERNLFLFVDGHLRKYQTVPSLKLVTEKFPELISVTATESPKYYVDKLAERFSYDTVAKANKESHEILKEDPSAVDAAVKVLQKAVAEVAEQRYRNRITDFGAEGKDIVLQSYYNTMKQIDPPAAFGWPYLDGSSGGILPGDFISIVGRPAMGKSFKMLYVAIHNWLAGKNVLFVSMEMNTLAIAQRTSSMYTHINLTQLKSATFSSHSLGLFRERISEAEKETGKLYIVDGNLAADPEDIYTLAVQLKCQLVLVDGGYLLRNRNTRLGRYEKVAENVESMKRYSSDLDLGTLASFQFSREATKKKKTEKAGLEDIGYSDAIGQISTIALGLMQEDGIETMQTRLVDVMKGRNGEIGQFRIRWDFTMMDFSQVEEETQKAGYDTSSI